MHKFLIATAITCAAITHTSTVSAQRQWTVTGQDVPELRSRRPDDSHEIVQARYPWRIGCNHKGRSARLRPGLHLGSTRAGSCTTDHTVPHRHHRRNRLPRSRFTNSSKRVCLPTTPGARHSRPSASRVRSRDPRLDAVTVDHLLTHTRSAVYCGIDDGLHRGRCGGPRLVDLETPPTKREIASYMIAEPFQFDPGSSWDYNNYGYSCSACWPK